MNLKDFFYIAILCTSLIGCSGGSGGNNGGGDGFRPKVGDALSPQEEQAFLKDLQTTSQFNPAEYILYDDQMDWEERQKIEERRKNLPRAKKDMLQALTYNCDIENPKSKSTESGETSTEERWANIRSKAGSTPCGMIYSLRHSSVGNTQFKDAKGNIVTVNISSHSSTVEKTNYSLISLQEMTGLRSSETSTNANMKASAVFNRETGEMVSSEGSANGHLKGLYSLNQGASVPIDGVFNANFKLIDSQTMDSKITMNIKVIWHSKTVWISADIHIRGEEVIKNKLYLNGKEIDPDTLPIDVSIASEAMSPKALGL